MKKCYDEEKLKKVCFCKMLAAYPEYIVLPISGIKEWRTRIDSTNEKNPKYSLFLNKCCIPQNDYLLILEKIGTDENRIYREMITGIDFSCKKENVNNLFHNYQDTINQALSYPLAVDITSKHYELDEKAKIEFGLNTLPNREEIKKIVMDLKNEAYNNLKSDLDLILNIDWAMAERENALIDTDNFLKSRQKRKVKNFN